MIGLSPLSPGHRRTFQRTSVRPSTGSYPRFSLPRDSSPGFASAARDWNRPFRTRFRSGSLPSLTSPRASNSLAHSTKGTPSHREGAPTPCGRTVSGTVSLPSRGAFHLSFTVLYAIGHWVVFRVGGWSPRIPTRFHVSGRTLDPAQLLSLSSTWFSHSLTGLPMPFD